jgi:hypothetical protein
LLRNFKQEIEIGRGPRATSETNSNATDQGIPDLELIECNSEFPQALLELLVQ